MGLPVEVAIPDLERALADHGQAILTAPPGSGKTTVAPLRLLDTYSRIVMLEPRRVATRAAARWMANTLGEEVGQTVGYVTRDDRRTGPATRLEVVTEGILTRRLQSDPLLTGVDLVIFDEFHERNLQSDLGLALTLDVRRSVRPDLAILVMSATLDAQRLSTHLAGSGNPAPVVEAEGLLHPVEVRWRPPSRGARIEEHVAITVRHAFAVDRGDILVFLPGIGEIERARRALGDLPATVHRLHGSLSVDEQDAALSPGTHRKVILSTDIAESSLTVEGVSVVIDDGRSRVPRYDPRTGMTRLTTVTIPRSSADQRAGRAGRLGPGIAYRLWSKIEHAARKAHAEPELTQVDLGGFVLDLLAWGATAGSLPFLDPPPPRSVDEAMTLLASLGAIDDGGVLTDLGRTMSNLPVHPRLGAMLAGAGDHLELAAILAAILEDRDPFRGPPHELPIDLALRASVVAGIGRHPAADDRGLDRIRRDAADLVRRTGMHGSGPIDPGESGRLLAMAYPDRLAIRRGTPGRFQLRTGPTAFCDAGDVLATEAFLIAADLDGKRRDSRIRLAAAIDPADVADRFASEVSTETRLEWSGDRLVLTRERRLGGLVLDSSVDRPPPDERTVDALLDRIRTEGLDRLPWSDRAIDLRTRSTLLHRKLGEPWPDLSDAHLTETLDVWLGPHLVGATSLEDVRRLDFSRLVAGLIGHLMPDLDLLAPAAIELPTGRRRRLDYSGDVPVLSVRVQELFGLTTTPVVAGEPIVIEMLSPAGRPVQVTRDLEGFWTGTWHDVRKDMAGRYPKHAWPADPSDR